MSANAADPISNEVVKAINDCMRRAIEEGGYLLASMHFLTTCVVPVQYELGMTDEESGLIVQELHLLLRRRLAFYQQRQREKN